MILRELEGRDEFLSCVALQEETWGSGFSERVPPVMLMIASRLGGVVAGAFDQHGEMAGFVFGLTGWEDGAPVHWSDMLAIRKGLRDGGIGTRLKLFQRKLCLERGIRLMYWTYDPLESRNAWLNFGKLGAVSREYARDLYGASDSPLHRGIGTDRLIMRWELDSSRVVERLAGREPAPTIDEMGAVSRAFEVDEDAVLPIPGEVGKAKGVGRLLVPVPARLHEMSHDAELALGWRAAVRQALEASLAAGWEVRELLRTEGAVSYLLLERP